MGKMGKCFRSAGLLLVFGLLLNPAFGRPLNKTADSRFSGSISKSPKVKVICRKSQFSDMIIPAEDGLSQSASIRISGDKNPEIPSGACCLPAAFCLRLYLQPGLAPADGPQSTDAPSLFLFFYIPHVFW